MSATQTLTYTCPHCHTMVDVLPNSGQELVTCPACNKPFQVKVPEAEPVNQLVLPSSVLDQQMANGRQADAQTEEEKRPLLVAENTQQKEEHIRTIHLNMFRRYPGRVLGYSAMIVGGIIIAIVLMTNDWRILSYVMWALAAFGVFRLFLWWLRMQNTTLTLTTRRVIVENGVISKRTTEVPTKDIAELNVGQNFITRMLGVGDLTIISSGPQSKTLVVMAVPDPTDVAAQIRGHGLGKDSIPK